MVEIRKGKDSPKPPHERGLQGRLHTAEAIATKSIRSKTLPPMRVWGGNQCRQASRICKVQWRPLRYVLRYW